MGTNYYLNTEIRIGDHKHATKLHIGKSSAGWVFMLRAHPLLGLNDLPDWQRVLRSGQIEDEYGLEVSVEGMLSEITERSNPHPRVFTQKALDINRAVHGPNGLLRSNLTPDGVPSRDIRHGSGTWDIWACEFF